MSLHPIPRPLPALLREAGLDVPTTLPDIPVSGISTDSRTIAPGEVFVAIPGLSTDARGYIPAAIARGAVAIVTEGGEVPPSTAERPPIILVPSARVAAACLYDAWYDHPARRLRLVGVSGTNGKTSVSSMLYHILTVAGLPAALIGTVGCTANTANTVNATDTANTATLTRPPDGMTTPDPGILYPWLARLADGLAGRSGESTATDTAASNAIDTPARGEVNVPCPTVIMEVTSHALALGKVAPLRFDLAIFTNLSPEHLDMHGTMEEYYLTKRRLYEVAREVVLDADDRYGRRLLAEPLPVRHFHICHAAGLDGLTADHACPAGDGCCTRYYAESPNLLGEDGVSFKLTSPDVRLRLACPTPGRFTVMNALEAAAAAFALGVSPAAVREGLRSFPGVPGRMERIPLPPQIPFSVYVDFAHTPDALEHLLGAAHAIRHRGRRIVLLFGCGGDRDRSKRRAMARVASRMADSVVITSDNSRTEDPAAIIRDILGGMDKESEFAVIPDRREAIRETVRTARPGDIILLAGKGHETYEITRDGKHPFSETAIVRDAVREFWLQDRSDT